MLRDIVKAVGEKCEIYVDGGVRRGTDVFKCLALGADMVSNIILFSLLYERYRKILHLYI